MKARNVMTVDVATVAPRTPLKKAHLRMLELGVRHMPVVSRGGRLVGIVSDRDLMGCARRRKGRLELPEKPVRSVMSRVPLTRRSKTTVSELAHLMIDEKIDAVPIVKADRTLVGLVTSTDLMMLLTDYMSPAARIPFTFSLRHAED